VLEQKEGRETRSQTTQDVHDSATWHFIETGLQCEKRTFIPDIPPSSIVQTKFRT
jgi:hypothetical protein